MEDNQVLAEQLRTVLGRLVRKLRKLSSPDGQLSQTERSILVQLDNNGKLLAAELAVMEKITPQSMGQLLNHLAELDLITKAISTEDKRKVFISLSATGKSRLQKVRRERDEWLSMAIAKVCTQKEQDILLKAIAPLTKLVDLN
jgi:DNA-binding MarR family transcriptional regulator